MCCRREGFTLLLSKQRIRLRCLRLSRNLRSNPFLLEKKNIVELKMKVLIYVFENVFMDRCLMKGVCHYLSSQARKTIFLGRPERYLSTHVLKNNNYLSSRHMISSYTTLRCLYLLKKNYMRIFKCTQEREKERERERGKHTRHLFIF